jgi:asparagine synthetase B (glutamine-hydrolysing)
MCGLIAGIGKVSLATLDKAVATLTHRGPESSATWVSENQSMFLGHTRLSIIGLDNGAQPISNADGNVHIVVNGEFYGYQGHPQPATVRGSRVSRRNPIVRSRYTSTCATACKR